MTYREGILVSENTVVNAAAIGAEIDHPVIEFEVYIPSDTARNLDKGVRFTYSLTKDPSLFFKAALTGHDDPRSAELDKSQLITEGDFIYPKEVTKVYFCEVEEVSKKTIQDEYGTSELKEIKGNISEKMGGKKDLLDRENSLIDAMVYASRMYVADERQKKQIYKKVKSVLKDTESPLKKKIIGFVEAHLDEI